MPVADAERWWPSARGEEQTALLSSGSAPDDNRTPFERDRDRLLYADEFERLRGVTQVVSPTEGILCHDRHSHSLRVEQLAMRMATNERLLASRPAGAPTDLPHPQVVAAAALAHDIGHPPFGHVAEAELDTLLRSETFQDPDGYEGNAQSFRILTRLASHRAGGLGLRLTRRVLLATLKYPWLSGTMPAPYGPEKRKYGAYADDQAAFDFVTKHVGITDGSRRQRSIDAAVMDAADAITYSVHDLFDFYRAGLIDLGRAGERAPDEIAEIAGAEIGRGAHLLPSIQRLFWVFSDWPGYDDSRHARENVQTATSHLITTLLEGHTFAWNDESGWSMRSNDDIELAMRFMHGLTRRYVIDSDTLAATQVGHRRVVKRLFRMYLMALVRDEVRVFPSFFRVEAQSISNEVRAAMTKAAIRKPGDFGELRSAIPSVALRLRRRAGRLAADTVASLTDRQALALSARVSGMSPQDGFAGQRDA